MLPIDANNYTNPVYSSQQQRITVHTSLLPAGLDLLKRTIYGTTGIRYQHTNQEIKSKDLINPLYFHLWRGDQLVGLYCLDQRIIDVDANPVMGFYGRYLTVDESQANQGFGRLLKQQAIRFVEENTSPPFLFYSYIEAKNARSVAISTGEGFRTIATLKSFLFRRLWPQPDKRLSRATGEDIIQIRDLLNEFYQRYTLKSFHGIGYEGNYFVLKESGRIVAGVQANPTRWRVTQMPGWYGPALVKLGPYLPLVRRVFNPEKFVFAVIEGVYLAEGREDLLPVLLESVLAHLGLYSTMCQIDERDPLYELYEAKNMGPLSGFQADVKTYALIRAAGVPDPWLNTSQPLYLSCFDYA